MKRTLRDTTVSSTLAAAPLRPLGIAPRALGKLLVGAALALGCASPAPFEWATPAHGRQPEKRDEARIQTGDSVAVVVDAQEPFSATYEVGSEGHIVVPLVGAVPVAGKRPEEVAVTLQAAFARTIESPRVTVVIVSKKLEVSVLGEVAQPGKYAVSPRDGLAAALALAGGLTEFAADDSIYLIRPGITRLRFRMRDLTAGQFPASEFSLRDGDVVFVE